MLPALLDRLDIADAVITVDAVGAENLHHLGRCFAGRRRLGHANGAWRAGLVRAGVR